jgi:hypothetical protein
VFPRIDSTKIRTAPNRILEMQGQRRYNEMDKFNDYMSGYPTSRTPRIPKGAGKVKPEEYTTLPTGTRVLKKDLVRSKMLNQYLGSGKSKRGGR